MSTFRKFVPLLGILFLLSGCAPTQTIVKSFINTQKQVDFKTSEYADPARIVGDYALVYAPPHSSNQKDVLADFAPIIVQGVEAPKDERYARDSDEIGAPELSNAPGGGYQISLITKRPTLYASVEKTHVHGEDLTQLVYVYWYPRHPVGSIEKGDIDGGVLRITLDAGGRPSVYEYVSACGCWHGAFVGEHVEAWAEKEFPEKVHGKRWSVEKSVDGDDDWKIRDLVLGGQKKARPVVFVSAGKHQCEAIQTTEVVRNLEKLDKRSYTIEPYDVLNHLPVTDKGSKETGSMFNSEGLVWGARRPGEEKLFSKLDHGGWPRRLDGMKIHWDEMGWNEANLLDKFLRLPREITDPNAVADAYKH